ncbi:MAG: hypothetical protein ACE14L_00920 [Terriglobales bacterium]
MEVVVALTIEEIENRAGELGIRLTADQMHEVRHKAGPLIGGKLEQLGVEILDSCIVAYAVMSGLPIAKPVREELMQTIRTVAEEDKPTT